jgi:lipoprotein-anchoring transpeptidase ErfK/SrfK
MTNGKWTRRDFLKVSAAGLVGVAFRPFFGDGENLDGGEHLVRVAVNQVSIYKEPSDKSEIQFQVYRNELLHVYYEVIAEEPKWNPLWYRVWGGWVHSAHMQTVVMKLNPVLTSVREGGQVMEVTVPYTRSMWFTKARGWEENYLLYYGSNHWVVDIDTGPDGEPWYVIENDLLRLNFFVPAEHLRPIPDGDLTPIRPDVPLGKKHIDIDIINQRLTAYEYGEVVLHSKVSTGLLHRPSPGVVPLATPKGDFVIQSKMPSKHMGDGILTDDPEEYVLPGVPYVSFFQTQDGIAIHGTYWHTNYGIPMSHGCVNMLNEEARFIYRWSAPYPDDPARWHTQGYGTSVRVF